MAKLETRPAGETLAHKKLDIQKLLAPAALVILYVFFSFAGNNLLTAPSRGWWRRPGRRAR